jgi:hypothetical protein
MVVNISNHDSITIDYKFYNGVCFTNISLKGLQNHKKIYEKYKVYRK